MSTHTRTRSIKPSIRLKQSVPLSFPPPHVILHPDDASSKILAAIARALLSVDNRAMTIKDLAEHVVQYGYVSTTSSAASQAILTYIRTHYQRCDQQQDQPILLRHTMSGTIKDDDLFPALQSKFGGANELPTENRLTHFRRGTQVYYLSRVTGAPCPFARASIRLSDYAVPDLDKAQTSSSSPHVLCGQKRKRRSTRECVLNKAHALRSPSPLSPLSSDQYTSTDVDEDSSDEEQPPPVKIKLTLKLPPLAQVMAGNRNKDKSNTICTDQSASNSGQQQHEHESCLPPYPRRSISIPPYTPSAEFPAYSSCFPLSYAHQLPHPQTSSTSSDSYRRSPSIPYSVASPPPDSDEEMDEQSLDSDDEPDRDSSVSIDDDDDDIDYQDEPTMDSSDWADDEDEDDWEEEVDEASPGPATPSVHVQFQVKEEPTDVQGLLDRWDSEDAHDVKVEIEPTEIEWEFPAFPFGSASSPFGSFIDSPASTSSSVSPPRIKQEEGDDFSFADWRDQSEILMSPTSPTGPSGFSFNHFHDEEPMLPADPTITQSLTKLINEMSFGQATSSPPQPPCVSPDETRIHAHFHSSGMGEVEMTTGQKPIQAIEVANSMPKSSSPPHSPVRHSLSAQPILSLSMTKQEELPLSPKEEEMFQQLCVNLAWEDEERREERQRSPSPLSSCPSSRSSSPEPVKVKKMPRAKPEKAVELPTVRRSKRVANKLKR